MAPLEQVLNDGTTNLVYGLARIKNGTGTWYQHDGLGSVRAVLDAAGVVQSSTQYDPWGTPQTALADSFGFTGELHDGDLVHLRARWYHPSIGTFTSRDPFAGFDTLPYSLHPYQYAYSNPVLLTDPSGELVPALIAAAALGIAAYAWLSNPSPVNAPAPGAPTVPSDHQAADMAFLENAPVTGEINDVMAAATGRSFSGEPQNQAASAAATLFSVAGGGFIRRALKLCPIELGDLAKLRPEMFDAPSRPQRLQGLYDEDFWQDRGGRILDPHEYPPSPFPLHRQPDQSSCSLACARMAEERFTGLYSDIVDIHADLALKQGGLFLNQLEPILQQRGWQTDLDNYKVGSALNTMEQALANDEAVIAGIFGHAVLVRSVRRSGADSFVIFNDPASGQVVELPSQDWMMLTGGLTELLLVRP